MRFFIAWVGWSSVLAGAETGMAVPFRRAYAARIFAFVASDIDRRPEGRACSLPRPGNAATSASIFGDEFGKASSCAHAGEGIHVNRHLWMIVHTAHW